MPFSDGMNPLGSRLKNFLFGATTYEMVKSLEERKVLEEYLSTLITFGDMLGYPISFYYRLRLLPFWVPEITGRSFIIQMTNAIINMTTHYGKASDT